MSRALRARWWSQLAELVDAQTRARAQGLATRCQSKSLSASLSPILAGVENPEHEHIGFRELVPDLVVPHQDPTDLSRGKLGEANAEARMNRNPLDASDKLAHGSPCCGGVNWQQELVHTRQI
jgi:hypothetical protein